MKIDENAIRRLKRRLRAEGSRLRFMLAWQRADGVDVHAIDIVNEWAAAERRTERKRS